MATQPPPSPPLPPLAPPESHPADYIFAIAGGAIVVALICACIAMVTAAECGWFKSEPAAPVRPAPAVPLPHPCDSPSKRLRALQRAMHNSSPSKLSAMQNALNRSPNRMRMLATNELQSV